MGDVVERDAGPQAPWLVEHVPVVEPGQGEHAWRGVVVGDQVPPVGPQQQPVRVDDERPGFGGIASPVADTQAPGLPEVAGETRDVDATGLVSTVEDFNAVQAWLGSLPGHAYADVRRPLVSSLNLCDLIPLSSVWAGPSFNAHLDAPVLMHVKARGGTAFRLDLHQGDVGHTLVAGPTGSGKSTLLNLIMAQWLRYADAQVVGYLDVG